MKCVLISVSELTLITDPLFQAENEAVVYELGLLNAEWHSESGVTPGTIAASGRKLIPATIELESSDPVTLLRALFLIYNLDWQLLACQEYDGSVVYLPAQPEVYQFLPARYLQIGEGQMEQLTPDSSWIPRRDGQAPWI